MRRLDLEHQLRHRTGTAGHPTCQLRDPALSVPGGESSTEEDDTAAAPDEFDQAVGLAWHEAVVAGCQDHSASFEPERGRIGDHIDVDVVCQVERAQDRAGEVEVIMGAAGEQRLHGYAASTHPEDGTTLSLTKRSGAGLRALNALRGPT